MPAPTPTFDGDRGRSPDPCASDAVFRAQLAGIMAEVRRRSGGRPDPEPVHAPAVGRVYAVYPERGLMAVEMAGGLFVLAELPPAEDARAGEELTTAGPLAVGPREFTRKRSGAALRVVIRAHGLPAARLPIPWPNRLPE